MMKKKSTWLIALAIFTVAIFFSSINDERIILCSLGSEFKFIDDSICTSYIETFGVGADFIETVNNDYGITFILSSASKNKFKIANKLLTQGVSINSINNIDGMGLPPLHSAFLVDDIDSFKFILKHNVKINAIYKKTGENIFEYAKRLLSIKPTTEKQLMLDFLLATTE
ncbi:hypothetical protein ACQKP8_27135 [Photobacterium alginatilyticum]|uniref:hypothetical protein n=1 Tax=Photobacterium alginatilyticum TaxID=1775171 RepID=UPI0040688C67